MCPLLRASKRSCSSLAAGPPIAMTSTEARQTLETKIYAKDVWECVKQEWWEHVFCDEDEDVMWRRYADVVETKNRIVYTHTHHLRNKPFTHKQTFLHPDTFTHRPFYTQTLVHTDACTHRRFYTQTLSYTGPFTHKHFYTQTLFYTTVNYRACTKHVPVLL